MGSRLMFSVESQGRQYAALELHNGRVVVKMGGTEMRCLMLAHAVQWVKERNPFPASEASIRLVSAG